MSQDEGSIWRSAPMIAYGQARTICASSDRGSQRRRHREGEGVPGKPRRRAVLSRPVPSARFLPAPGGFVSGLGIVPDADAKMALHQVFDWWRAM